MSAAPNEIPKDGPRENPEGIPEQAPTPERLDRLKGEVVRDVKGAEVTLKQVRETMEQAEKVRADTKARRLELARKIQQEQKMERGGTMAA